MIEVVRGTIIGETGIAWQIYYGNTAVGDSRSARSEDEAVEMAGAHLREWRTRWTPVEFDRIYPDATKWECRMWS